MNAARRFVTSLTGAFIIGALLLLALLFLVVASRPNVPTAGPNSGGIGYWHDDAHRVSCWTYARSASNTAAISCLPDAQVRLP